MQEPTRIQAKFRALKEAKRAALVAYVTAGDPAPQRTPAIVAALERGGADVIELGVPFSDPIADGPVIQAASERALKAGTTVAKVLDIARKIRETSQIPLVLFTYLNPALRYGLEKLAHDAKAAGIDGCLLTDLSVEEAGPYVKTMRAAGLDTVFLAAPTSTPERLQLIASYSTGFVWSRAPASPANASCSPMRPDRWLKPHARSRSCRWPWASASPLPNRLRLLRKWLMVSWSEALLCE